MAVSREEKLIQNKERQKRYQKSHDRTSVWFDKGVLDRISALGYSANSFINQATMERLEREEKIKNEQ